MVALTDVNTAGLTRYSCDADGRRVKTERPDGTVIYTPHPDYGEEVTSSATTVRIYCLFGGRAITLRVTSSPAGPDNGCTPTILRGGSEQTRAARR